MPQCHSVSVCQCSMQCPQCSLFPVFSACPSATVLSVSQYFLCPGVPTPMSQCSQWSKRYSIQWSQCLSVTMFLVSQCPTVFPVLQCSQRYSAPNVTVFSVTTFPESQCPVVLQCSQCSRCASVPCSIPSVQCSHCSQCPSILHVPVLSVSKYFLCPAFPVSQWSKRYSIQWSQCPSVTMLQVSQCPTVFPVLQ